MKKKAMIRSIGLGVVLVLLALANTGCDLFSPPGGTIIVQNNSAEDIWFLYASPQSSPDWGPERLGLSTILPIGGSFAIEDLDPDTYDIGMEFESEAWFEDYGIILGSGETITYIVE